MIELESLISPEEYAKFVWELGGGYFTYRPGPIMYMVTNFDTNPSYLELSEEFSKLVNELFVYLKDYSDRLLSDLSKMEIKYD